MAKVEPLEDKGDTEDMARVGPADDSFDTENTEVESGSTEEVRGEDMDLGEVEQEEGEVGRSHSATPSLQTSPSPSPPPSPPPSPRPPPGRLPQIEVFTVKTVEVDMEDTDRTGHNR